MIQYNALHWGEVQRSITIEGGDPASGITNKVKGRSKVSRSIRNRSSTNVKGSGGRGSVG